MIYQCVAEVESEISVKAVLKILRVSTSGYYAWKKRKPSKQSIKKKITIEMVKEIHEESNEIYGAPKITIELHKRGISITERTVGLYMRESGLRAWYRKPYTQTTVDSDFSTQLKNILKRDFSPKDPNAVWCSDITYIWTKSGFVYLTSIMDLYSRKIIAWEITDNLSTEGVVRCIEIAKEKRKINKPIVIHTDRGTQYVSNAYKEVLGDKFIRSYSRKGNPWDNACIESFHALIKREWLNRYIYNNMIEVRSSVFEYIEIFYNRKRIHETLGYKSPHEYEESYFKKH